VLPRIAHYLRVVAPLGRDHARIGPFLATFSPHDDNPFLNYALPDPGAQPTEDDIAALVDAYRDRARRPRLEYLPATAPDLEEALSRAGFRVEGRLPLMVLDVECLPDPAPEVEGVAFGVPETDADLLAMAVVQGAAYEDPTVPGPEVVARRRAALADGALALVARRTADEAIIGAGSCAPIRDGLTEVAALAVAAPHRRRGIGSGLTARLAALALAHGADVPWLMAEGAPEERLYARLGFRTVGEVLLISLPAEGGSP
jgi:GNAT superfamily N-acetyltransferase